MSGTNLKLHTNQLINYYENPRHAIGISEDDTMQKLFESVGIQYMLNLAEDIQKHGLLRNQQIVVVFSEKIHKYIIYEGNRRIAAIKLLQNPDSFSFLDRASIDRAKRISEQGDIPTEIDCYATDEDEAFLIMERLHSGEDKGRGTKQWSSREKEAFKVRRSHQKKTPYLIDYYSKKYFDGFDITTILPFTTIERIFNNREIKRKIGIDAADERTFSPARIKLIIDASNYVVQAAAAAGMSVTRLFNKARTIAERLIPWLDEYLQGNDMEADLTVSSGGSTKNRTLTGTNNTDGSGDSSTNQHVVSAVSDSTGGTGNVLDNTTSRNSTGGSRNLPYFFQGINFSALDPNDADSHGVSAVCKELRKFSDRKLVQTFPIASAFLVRAVIEQSIIYYSKKNTIQGQNKRIWEDIKDIKNLSSIISRYKRNLPNYIVDKNIQEYFNKLFGNYEENINPLNWVVHRPAEFRLDASTLIELPRKGLLAIINFMISY